MIFKATRTSNRYNNKPFSEAVQKPFPVCHVRTCTEEYFNKNFAEIEGLWRSKGSGHTVTKEGHIKRMDGMEDVWCVDIGSLEDLMVFIKKYGAVVVGEDSIEIYDYYRE